MEPVIAQLMMTGVLITVQLDVRQIAEVGQASRDGRPVVLALHQRHQTVAAR
jgi:hypothetical protein